MQGRRLPWARISAARFALSVGRAAKGADQIVLHAGPGKNVGTQQVDAAAPQRRRPLLHHAVGFHLVDGVGESVSGAGASLRWRARANRNRRRRRCWGK